MDSGKKNVLGKLNFPGFQEILDFTSAGSESSVSVAVDGDTDKEYKIVVRTLSPSKYVIVRLNNDYGGNYVQQYIYNNSGSISSDRGTATWMYVGSSLLGIGFNSLLTPTGLIKSLINKENSYISGTTVPSITERAWVWNNTANVTTLNFSTNDATNFTSGTRICVFARRSNV